MKNIYILLFSLLFQSFLFAQDSQLYLQGYFYNTRKKPQNNLVVTNQTSGYYDFTDANGYLIIEAKAGDTLRYNKKDFRVVQASDLKEMKTIVESKNKYESANPILSKDYSGILKTKIDSTNFLQLKTYVNKNNTSSNEYKSIKKTDSGYVITQLRKEKIFYSGSLQMTTEIGTPNAEPKLQNQFLQGRNANGRLQWNGPETSEMFSFGPDISTLGFDGNPYTYDINGRLTDRNKSISPAKIYDNSVLQNTQKTSNFLSINSYFEKNGSKKWNAGLEFGYVREDLLIKDQFQDTKNFGLSLAKNILNGHDLSFNYKFNNQKATNTNRTGLFNRAYQSALLTPISFENSQGNILGDRQRSYSLFFDNPNYLLQNTMKYNFDYHQNTFNLKFAKANGKFQYLLEETYENTQFSNYDIYKPFTSGFPNGIAAKRHQNNSNSSWNAGGSYTFQTYYNGLQRVHFNAIFNESETEISYTGFEDYRYNRFSQDYIMRYQFRYRNFIFRNFTLEGDIGNGFYVSNTVKRNEFFIPKLSLSLDMERLIDYNFGAKIFGSFHKNISEPSLTKSYSSFLLTQIDDHQLNTYFPVQEVASFKNLEYINDLESKLGILIYPHYSYQLEAFITNKKFTNDIFPIFENGKIVLKNLVNHTTRSYDINLSTRNLLFKNSTVQVGFNKTTSKVNHVLGGYDSVPISGFNTIYRGMVKGEALGVLVGTAYQRNDNGDLIIGSDGFPLVSSDKKILGNPIPDFTMKFSYIQNIKDFSLNLDLEWRKGGDIWNGTQANLDYYGRSEKSANRRNVSNYVYNGVLQDGSINTIPVDFFDINQPFEQNRFYRYGSLGVAEDYIVDGDALRINNITLSYNFKTITFLRSMKISAFAKNILLWSKSRLDAQTSFFDNENGQGLDFYNLPSMRSYGCSVSFLF